MVIDDDPAVSERQARGAGLRPERPAATGSDSRRASAELDRLIGPAAAGDQRAVNDIIRIVYPLMRRYCYARVGSGGGPQVSAEDIAQEICIATVAGIPRYRDQGKSFLAFVYGIAANKVADAFRRAQQQHSFPMAELPETASAAAGPEELALTFETRRTAAELMKILAPAHREVLVMRIVLGWTAAQTAEAIGTSPGVVRVMQHRALRKLRAHITDTA